MYSVCIQVLPTQFREAQEKSLGLNHVRLWSKQNCRKLNIIYAMGSIDQKVLTTVHSSLMF